MPEGHLIHRYARRLHAALAGEPVRTSSPQGRFAAEAAELDGVPLELVEAHGKHLFAHFATDAVVHVHLGQAGLFLEHGPEPPAPRPSVRLRLVGARGAFDLIAPTRCALVSLAARDAVVARLGPDPVLAAPDDPDPPQRLLRARTPVGVALLDQSVWAGIGNAYRAELLYLLRVHPLRPAAALDGTAERLWRLACAQLRLGAEAGAIATVDGRTQAQWWVYKQATCHGCGAPVEVGEIGGRTSYHCPREQLLAAD
ncbi:MAG: Fpg/Nei family DNA glycosylase [Frankiaceae bacterium]